MLDNTTFPILMGGPSDGIVFSVSQGNGQSTVFDITASSGGVVHSGGAETLGFGTISTLPDCRTSPKLCASIETLLDGTASAAVVQLLNTSVADPVFVRGQ
jgi:hypothetical protein